MHRLAVQAMETNKRTAKQRHQGEVGVPDKEELRALLESGSLVVYVIGSATLAAADLTRGVYQSWDCYDDER